MSELLHQIGQTVKNLRENKNMGIDECAKLSGLTRAYLRQVENGERNITIKTLESVAKTLDVHPSVLMKNENSPSSNQDEEELIQKLCSTKSKRDLKCVIALLNSMSD